MTKKAKKSVFLPIFLLITIAMTAILLAGCGKDVPVKEVKINYDSIEIYKGQVVPLDYDVLPNNANNYTLTIKSSDKSIVALNSSGYLMGVNYGTATITIAISDTELSDSCTVTVGDGEITEISLNTAGLKTTYYENDRIDISGLKVFGKYQSGKEEELDLAACKITHPEYAVQGAKIVVEYEGAYAQEVNLTILKDGVEGLEVTTSPTKTEYYFGERFDQSGMKVALKYRSGKTEEVQNFTIENAVIQPGQKEITIKYGDYQTKISITSNARRIVISFADLQSAIDEGIDSVMLAHGFTSTFESPLVLENVKNLTIYSERSTNSLNGQEIIPIKIVGKVENVKFINFTISSTGESPAAHLVDFSACTGGTITFKDMTFNATQTDALLVPAGNPIEITFSNCTYTKNA